MAPINMLTDRTFSKEGMDKVVMSVHTATAYEGTATAYEGTAKPAISEIIQKGNQIIQDFVNGATEGNFEKLHIYENTLHRSYLDNKGKKAWVPLAHRLTDTVAIINRMALYSHQQKYNIEDLLQRNGYNTCELTMQPKARLDEPTNINIEDTDQLLRFLRRDIKNWKFKLSTYHDLHIFENNSAIETLGEKISKASAIIDTLTTSREQSTIQAIEWAMSLGPWVTGEIGPNEDLTLQAREILTAAIAEADKYIDILQQMPDKKIQADKYQAIMQQLPLITSDP